VRVLGILSSNYPLWFSEAVEGFMKRKGDKSLVTGVISGREAIILRQAVASNSGHLYLRVKRERPTNKPLEGNRVMSK